MITKLKNLVLGAYRWRYYLLHQLVPRKSPEFNLAFLPDGLTVRKVGETGVSIVENFCTAEEANEIRRLAEPNLAPAKIIRDGKAIDHPKRRCDTATIFGADHPDGKLLPIACRAAALTGLPYTHMEGVVVTRYGEGQFYEEHVDFGKGMAADRVYTVLVYLNDLAPEQGGTTVFPKLKMEVAPKLGRAVCWTNINPDGSGHQETAHAAMPVRDGGEKWVIQFWFRNYKMFSNIKANPPQAKPGSAVNADTQMPAGASYLAMATEPEPSSE